MTQIKTFPDRYSIPSYILSDDEILDAANRICEVAHESDTGWSPTDDECLNSMLAILRGPRGREIGCRAVDGINKFFFSDIEDVPVELV